MGIVQIRGQPKWVFAALLVVVAIIWRLLYTWQSFMNLVWMNAAALSMALGGWQFFRPLGLFILTGTAVFLTTVLATVFILLQLRPRSGGRKGR